ncbi:MAG: DUF2452 domain-containing protein [Gammaproteobacteria bacterium]|nr:DUF2452 domain-containing protein [Gammaproteobacteria bacterium]
MERYTTDKSAIVLKADGNPEGKGHNALMRDWQRSEPQGAVAKPRSRILAEFFTSMLVLSAAFKFRPVAGAPHYLYWINGEWSLSLIAPDEWSQERREAFAGTCSLQRDMTWTITPSELFSNDTPVAAAMSRFYAGFAAMLDTDHVLEEILPFYAGRVPYYQRLYASALSRSVRTSMTLGQQTSEPGRKWHSLLPQHTASLLEHRG